MNILDNNVLVAAVIAWFFAQFFKLLRNLWENKRFDITYMFASGGMPSSHSSTVVALATMTGLQEGFNTTLFAISCIFAIVVMYDARGVRLAVSKQAVIINHMIQEKKFDFDKLNELVGHTQIQVVYGALLGLIVSLGYYFLIL